MKKIKSYTGIWNVEKVLYAINDFNLPFPVTFTQITWFVITEFIIILILDAAFGTDCLKTSFQMRYSIINLPNINLGQLQIILAAAGLLSVLATVSCMLFLSALCSCMLPTI